MNDTILLARPNGDLVEINPFGAELHRWRARGIELIRRGKGDPALLGL